MVLPKSRDVIRSTNVESASSADPFAVAASRVTEPTFQYCKSCHTDWVTTDIALAATVGIEPEGFMIQ